MPSPLRDTRSLSDWLELDYYRRPRRLGRAVRWIGGAVLVLSVAAVALTFFPGRPAVYQAAPLSPAHAMFNNQCNLCHTEGFETARRFWPNDARVTSVPDQACLRCHDGPLHNDQQVKVPGCASCHKEHRGHAQLAQIPNGQCTDCHADPRRKDGMPSRFPPVTGFDQQHPEFALFRDKDPHDPGQLHFNHEVHLRSHGIQAADGSNVKLNCASCHELEADRRYMKPVSYEKHCSQCHPLSVQIVDAGKGAAAVRMAEMFRIQPAPHVAPEAVRSALRERLIQAVKECPTLLETPAETVDPFPPGRVEAAPNDATAWVERQLRKNERLLFQGAGGCAFCHVRKEPPAHKPMPDLPVFEPTALPKRWFAHSRFSHDSHRLLVCTECHAATGSRQTADVLMPHIATCQKCHNAQVGAPSDCSNCHRYHDHDRNSGWRGRMTIDECLGIRPEK